MKNDLISRKAAIDALGERPMVWTDDDQYTLGEQNQYDRDRLAIGTLPSAEMVEKWMVKKVCEDEYGIEKFQYFCSECGASAYEFFQPYCHRCGARMGVKK